MNELFADHVQMKTRKRVIEAMVCICLLWIASAAHAENWVDTKHMILIDVDSIRKGADGFVHYNCKTRSYDEDGASWGSVRKAAYDCQKNIEYYDVTQAGWKSKGTVVRPNTMGSELKDFVCSRVK